jgi:hypothetical protein
LSLIFFLSLLPHFAFAGCLPSLAAHTLDSGNERMIGQLRQALTEAEGDEPVCDQDLAEKARQIDNWLSYLKQDVNAMAEAENAWARGILGRQIPQGAPTELACALHRDLSELRSFLERRQQRADEFDSKLDAVAETLLTVRAEKEIYAEPAKTKLLLDCRERFQQEAEGWDDVRINPEQETERRDACLAQADATPELWEAVKYLELKSEGMAAGMACLLDPSSRPAAEKNLALAEGVESGAKQLLRDSMRYLDELDKKAPALLAQTKKSLHALENRKCEDREKSETKKIELSARRLLAEDGHGTGFVLAGPDGKPELLSARHVAYRGESLESVKLYPLAITPEKSPRHGIEFEVKPGAYDRGRDLIKRPLSWAPASLTAVADGTVIPAGERVTIFGYPASREAKFTAHSCEVKGIGRNVFDTPSSESYLLSCPGAESHIAGMSGGPVTNEKGEVIGVVSAHNPVTNIVIVQPVSRGPTGENHFGFQSVFLSDHCFSDADISKAKRCQIIPGLTYKRSYP